MGFFGALRALPGWQKGTKWAKHSPYFFSLPLQQDSNVFLRLFHEHSVNVRCLRKGKRDVGDYYTLGSLGDNFLNHRV